MTLKRWSGRTVALASGDAAALLALHPRWEFVATGLWRPATWLDTAGADVAVAAVCVALLWLAAGWIALGLVAGLGARLPGATGRVCARFARVVLPKLLVRVVLGSTGLGLLATPAAQAMSSTQAAPLANVRTSATATSLHLSVAVSPRTGDEVPSPTWPVAPSSSPTHLPAPAPPTSGTPTHARSHPSTRVAPRAAARVHRGDSLWLLAAHRLGPHADAEGIARYWPQIYAANRSVIGDEPSLIHPGQVLDLPTPTEESPR